VRLPVSGRRNLHQCPVRPPLPAILQATILASWVNKPLMKCLAMTELLLNEIRSFVSAVSANENEPRLRAVITKCQSEDGQFSAFSVGLDRGESVGSEFMEIGTGLLLVAHGDLVSMCSGQKCVIWLKHLDSLTVGISSIEDYIEEMGAAQGNLVILRSC